MSISTFAASDEVSLVTVDDVITVSADVVTAPPVNKRSTIKNAVTIFLFMSFYDYSIKSFHKLNASI